MHTPLDEIDMRAVTLLARNGRMTWAELAQHLALSSPATAERVRRLEERGIIGGYGALLARDVLGYGLTAFIGIELANSSHRASFLARIKTLSEVLECHHITGDHDYLLKVACRTPLHLDAFLNDSIRYGDEVSRTRTVIVLSSPKETLFVPPA